MLFLFTTLTFSIGFNYLGDSLNYKLRNYYLSKNFIETNGIITNVIQLRINKLGQEKFYLIKSIKDKRVLTFNLPAEYVKKDKYNINKKLINFYSKTLNVKSIKNLKVKIIYSNKFNSFVKIID